MIKSSVNIKSLLFFVLILCFFSSCSQNLPDITHADSFVVFTYKDNESKPVARLSLFVQDNNDVRRCERLKIESETNNYVWETKILKNIAAGDFQWTGNVNFIVPEGEKIPQGKYNITYVNADGEEDKVSFTLKYEDKLYDWNADEMLENYSSTGTINLAIYNENHILLYFGEKTEELSTKGDIFNTFSSAVYYQDVFISFDKSVICILPESKL